MMILISRGTRSLDFLSIHVEVIFGLIILFITYMTCALVDIKTIMNFKHSIRLKKQKTFLHTLAIF